MNYLTFIDRIVKHNQVNPRIQFLVSGNDRKIRNRVLEDVVWSCHEKDEALIIIDDMELSGMENIAKISSCGYQIKNGMSGEYCLYNPFQITTVKELSKIRQLLSTLEYDEKQKGKLISYLNFIRHIEFLEHGNGAFNLTIEVLGKYCSIMAVEEKIQYLLDIGVIDKSQQMILLAKYSECSSAAADLEDLFFVLLPFISGEGVRLEMKENQAIVFRIGELGEDETMRNLVMQLLQFGIEENRDRKLTLLVFDKGYGSRKCILNLLKSIPSYVNIHIFSDDIFTFCDRDTLALFFNRFTARVYSRHLAMGSAETIEKICGEIDVAKNSYNVTYDRRWRSNRPWDVLMGKNKTETYTQTAPVREPRYRKEMIMGLSPGTGIVEFMGNTSVFAI